MVRSGQGGAGRGAPSISAGRGEPTTSAGRGRLSTLSRPALRPDLAAGVGLAVVLAAAAVLRLWALGRVPVNPFYDAAVRSMGLSWHNFFFGALEPGGQISVDKPPIDLWLQVASTKLVGFNTAALLVPEACGGIIAAGLLFLTLRPVFGLGAAVLGGLALAVLPISVLTSRSDTMDSVMMAILVAALWASVRGLRTRHVRWVLLAAALVGLAFNVKLSEALVPLPALGLVWLAVVDGRRRILVVAGAAISLVVVGMLWVFVASLTPTKQRPYPIGSRNGSIYQAVFVYNGIERLSGTSAQVAPVGSASTTGPTRLVTAGHPFLGRQIGIEIVAAVALGLACGLARLGAIRRLRRRRDGRQPREPSAGDELAHTRRWLIIGVFAWLTIGCVLFSAVRDLQPRYLEAVAPAVAAAIGIGGAILLRRARERTTALLTGLTLAATSIFALTVGQVPDLALEIGIAGAVLALLLLVAGSARRGRAAPRHARPSVDEGEGQPTEPRGGDLASGLLAAAVAVALLAAPVGVSVDLVDANATAAGTMGTGAEFSAYLHAHRHGAYYETASSSVYAVTTLIVHDAQPVLVLSDFHGPLVSLGRLMDLVRRRAVRHIIINHACRSGLHCPATTRWSLMHAREVVRGGLYEYILPLRQSAQPVSGRSVVRRPAATPQTAATGGPAALRARLFIGLVLGRQ